MATHNTQQTFSWIYAAHDDTRATKKFVSDLQRENRRAWKSSGHLTSRINTIQDRIIVPHIEWDIAQQGFTPRQPQPLPQLLVRIDIIQEAHVAFNHPISDEQCIHIHNHDRVDAYAYSGAQTCYVHLAWMRLI